MCQVIQRHLIVARGRQCHFEWLAFYTEQRFLNFKISFHFEFTSSVSPLLLFLGLATIVMMTRFSCRTKDIDFETKFLFGMCQVSRSLNCG